ncbi:unnamed protein product [Brassicogethes aeneus]|uniref:Uncharacterized protein n=1 Tax=Brassicogethes aeneus TaxID=1431903 RepID=A0A9P0B2Q0_BRAAE|nr:unnamed protein product [Brassicogethes aeneus]
MDPEDVTDYSSGDSIVSVSESTESTSSEDSGFRKKIVAESDNTPKMSDKINDKNEEELFKNMTKKEIAAYKAEQKALKNQEKERLLKEKQEAKELLLKEREEKRLEKIRLEEERQKAKERILKEREENRLEKIRLEEERQQQKLLREEEKLRLEEEKVKRKEEREQEALRKEEERIRRREERKEEAQIREAQRLSRKEEKRREEERQKDIRKEKALKGMKYLLGLSEKYTSFFQEKVDMVVKKKDVLQENNKYMPTNDDMKNAISQTKGAKKAKKDENSLDITKKLNYFKNGSLRPYQIEGVTWMSVLFDNGLNGILADEMGLGKTVQVIALICHLLEKNIGGPFLIVTPLSTIPNWKNEFERFAPNVPVVIFPGDAAAREGAKPLIQKKYMVGKTQTGPVVITNYGVPLRESHFLGRFTWQYVIVDEGHRIKNHKSKLSITLRNLNSSNRLLLTGTPLQNNISELWALLNFLLPHIFNNMDTFASLFLIEEFQDKDKVIENEENHSIISTIHKVLGPFMLRRLKSDVLKDMVPKKEVVISCPMTKLQKDLYKWVIDGNIQKLRREEEEEELDIYAPRKKRKCAENRKYNYYENINEDDFSDYEDEILETADVLLNRMDKKEKKDLVTRLTMCNPMIMFKKIVDHPYLVNFPLDPESEKKQLLISDELIKTSGKMIVLEKMLKKLKRDGHKVLLFSTLCMMMDLIEEMLIMKKIKYRRLDGSYSLEQRGECIDEFNNDPNIFIFLISTRAGGLGLNLTSADTVIFFDRDWNPQADIQAQDRCHRIGQTKPVCVYTLVLRNTIDEQIIDVGHLKRRLERLVIKDGKFSTMDKTDKNKQENDLLELKNLLEKEEEESKKGVDFSENELEKLLDRSDLYEKMEEMKAKENQPC